MGIKQASIVTKETILATGTIADAKLQLHYNLYKRVALLILHFNLVSLIRPKSCIALNVKKRAVEFVHSPLYQAKSNISLFTMGYSAFQALDT